MVPFGFSKGAWPLNGEVFDSDSQFEAQLWQQVLYQATVATVADTGAESGIGKRPDLKSVISV